MTGFSVGAIFSSYEEFEKDFAAYKRCTFSDYFIKDCRTLEAAKKRCPVRVEMVDEALKYYFIKFTCVHGGNYKKKTTGGRNTSSMRKGCEAFIYVKLSDDGTHLVITSMSENHNHELSQELFEYLPRQRRLPPEVQEEIISMLQLNANKKLIQEKYSSKLNKNITLKDLSNLKAKGNLKQSSFEEIVAKIQSDHDCTVKVMLDEEERNFIALYLQDTKMVKEFESYPEVMFADYTYKLTNLRKPIFVLMVENGNGESNVVAAGVFVSEEKDVFKWFLESFKSLNPASKNTKIVMADKDMTERNIFKEVFPQIRLRFCLFHVLKTFKRDISSQEMGLSPQETTLIRSTLQKMCYVSSLEEFDDLYETLKDISPERVINYFNKNWKTNMEEWTNLSDFQADTLFNKTNNRVESFNAKIKSVVSPFSTLEKFLDQFFIAIKCLRLERTASAAKALTKFTTQAFPSQDEEMYSIYTTPYAFTLIQKQFQEISHVTREICERYSTSESACKCSFFNSVHLPCKHILRYRQDHLVPLYDEGLVNLRWSRKYLGLTRKRPKGNLHECIVDIVPQKKAKTAQEKFKEATVVTDKLAVLISESDSFEEKVKFLESMYEIWASGQEVSLFDGYSNPPQDMAPPLVPEQELSLPHVPEKEGQNEVQVLPLVFLEHKM